MPSASLILPNKNNDRVLDLFFETLARNTEGGDFEVIAVDDGSTDRSREILGRWERSGRFPAFSVIEKPPTGIVETLNIALAAASGEIVVRLDGDATIETPGWLEAVTGFLGSDPRIGMVTGRTVFDDGRMQSYGLEVVTPEGVHDRGSTIAEPVGARTLDSLVERPLDRDSPLRDTPAEVDAAIGCFQAFPAALAAEIGGYDTRFSPVYVEDYDFALGVRRAGRKVFFLPDVHVVHRVGLRNPRQEPTRRERVLYGLRHRVGHLVPRALRTAAATAGKLGHHDPRMQERMRGHYAAWREKWGWDPLNPDMDAIRERWAGTEVWWAHDPDRRAAGEEILRRHRERLPAR